MSGDKKSSNGKTLFRQAMEGVKPLKKNKKIHREKPKLPQDIPQRRQEKDPDKTEPALSDFISEPVWENSILSFQQYPLPPKRWKQLKNGLIPYQDTLDLHGYRAAEAEKRLCNYLNQAKLAGIRCVLIIHGKGRHDGYPPRIKNLVNVWLPQMIDVIAFHSAIAKHGGTGAVYVLLKR